MRDRCADGSLAEARWFVPGDLPSALRPTGPGKRRVDSYSVAGLSPAASLKRRGDVAEPGAEGQDRPGRARAVRSAGRIRRVMGEVATWAPRRTPRLDVGSRSTSRRGTSTPARSVGCRWAGLGGGPSPWRPGEMACPHGVVNCWIRSSTSWRPAVRRTPMPAGCSSVTVDECDVAEPGWSAGAPSSLTIVGLAERTSQQFAQRCPPPWVSGDGLRPAGPQQRLQPVDHVCPWASPQVVEVLAAPSAIARRSGVGIVGEVGERRQLPDRPHAGHDLVEELFGDGISEIGCVHSLRVLSGATTVWRTQPRLLRADGDLPRLATVKRPRGR